VNNKSVRNYAVNEIQQSKAVALISTRFAIITLVKGKMTWIYPSW